MRPSKHWVCFPCRKQFRKPNPWVDVTVADETGNTYSLSRRTNVPKYICSDCRSELIDMGTYFKPPLKRHREAWKALQMLAEHGIRFTREYSVKNAPTTMRAAEEIIANCCCHVNSPGKQLKQKFAKRK